jgi:NADH-quinone oxidoreductase subunit K
MIPIEQVTVVSTLLFGVGFIGVLVRRNLISVMLSLQLMLAAVSLAFVGFNRVWAVSADGAARLDGQVFALVIASVGVAQLALGLGIAVAFVRTRNSTSIEDVSVLKW